MVPQVCSHPARTPERRHSLQLGGWTAKQFSRGTGRFLKKKRELQWLLPSEPGPEVSGISQRNLASPLGKLVRMPCCAAHLNTHSIGRSPASTHPPSSSTSGLRFNQSPDAPPYFCQMARSASPARGPTRGSLLPFRPQFGVKGFLLIALGQELSAATAAGAAGPGFGETPKCGEEVFPGP